jgi:hypothetical protein
MEYSPVVRPVDAENKLRPKDMSDSLDAQGYGNQGSFEEAYSQTPGGRGCGNSEHRGQAICPQTFHGYL